MKKKPMTIEQLAKIVKSAFDDITSRMATKDDLKGFATKEELRSGLYDIRKDMTEEFDRVHADMGDMKRSLMPLLRFTADNDVKI